MISIIAKYSRSVYGRTHRLSTLYLAVNALQRALEEGDIASTTTYAQQLRRACVYHAVANFRYGHIYCHLIGRDLRRGYIVSRVRNIRSHDCISSSGGSTAPIFASVRYALEKAVILPAHMQSARRRKKK